MLNLIANVLLFIVLAIGVWTIVCAVHNWDGARRFLIGKPWCRIKFDVWIARYADGYGAVFSECPVRSEKNRDEWLTKDGGGFIISADSFSELMRKINVTWKDEPLKATFTIDVKAEDYMEAKTHDTGE